MDATTYHTWFKEVFKPHVHRQTGHRILLLLDNAPGRSKSFEDGNIRVIFFHHLLLKQLMNEAANERRNH